jgi:hypothetical protein
MRSISIHLYLAPVNTAGAANAAIAVRRVIVSRVSQNAAA